MKLEETFYTKLSGQLSQEKTEVDVRVACMITLQYVESFTVWKDDNFNLYRTGKYYPKTNSKHFNIMKHINDEPTLFFELKELITLYSKENE